MLKLTTDLPSFVFVSQTYNNSSYTTCLEENQLVDVLEAGRGNVRGLSHGSFIFKLITLVSHLTDAILTFKQHRQHLVYSIRWS
jgi:hypothetical protein